LCYTRIFKYFLRFLVSSPLPAKLLPYSQPLNEVFRRVKYFYFFFLY